MAVAAVAQAAASGWQVYSLQKQGGYEASQHQQNARLADQQANAVLGSADVSDIRREARDVNARAVATVAANNISTTEGSFGNSFEAASLEQAELDAARVKADAAREAWGWQNQAKQSRVAAWNAKRAGILGAAGAALGGIGSIAGSFGGR